LHPLPSTQHSFDQQLSKQRATANNCFCPSTTKQEAPVKTPEVNKGRKCKNAVSAAESKPNPPLEKQRNNHTKVKPPIIGLFEPDVLFVADGGIGGLTKGIAMLEDTLCFENNDVALLCINPEDTSRNILFTQYHDFCEKHGILYSLFRLIGYGVG
jgi:hypothetical protein